MSDHICVSCADAWREYRRLFAAAERRHARGETVDTGPLLVAKDKALGCPRDNRGRAS